MGLVTVWTTVAAEDDARRIARACVERHLAACVQLSRVESFYVWDAALRHDDEIRMVFKTTHDRQAALEAALLELHPYDVPAIYAFDVASASPAYAQWVLDQTAGPPGGTDA